MACFTYKILMLASSLHGSFLFLDPYVILDFSSHSQCHSEAASDVVLEKDRLSGTMEPLVSHNIADVRLVCSRMVQVTGLCLTAIIKQFEP
jgi:hypothetical protein